MYFSNMDLIKLEHFNFYNIRENILPWGGPMAGSDIQSFQHEVSNYMYCWKAEYHGHA